MAFTGTVSDGNNGTQFQLGPFETRQELEDAYLAWAAQGNLNLGGAAYGPNPNPMTITDTATGQTVKWDWSSDAQAQQYHSGAYKREMNIKDANDYAAATPQEQAAMTAPSAYEGQTTQSGTGAPVPQGTNQAQGAPSANPQYQTAPVPTTAPTAPNQPVAGQPAAPQQQITPEQIQQALQQSGLVELMNEAGLTPDQQKAIEAVYQATLANDQAYAERITAAMDAAREFSSPYFEAQVSLVTDSLTRSLNSAQGDLAFREQQLQQSLTKLQQDTAASKEYLSFQHTQELQDLARRYEINLESTRQDMAATGFTQSSRRSKGEQYLSDVNEGAVESSNRQLAYQTGNLDRQLGSTAQDVQAQVANLQRLAAEGKLDLLRQTEQKIGSQGLSNLGYAGTDVLGGVGGEIPRAQAQDQLAFANSFIF